MAIRPYIVRSLYTLPILLLLLCGAAQAIAADVSLAWDASISPNIAGYKVYVGNSSRTYGSPISIGNQTSYTVTGLSSGTYYFTVTAFDVDGNESDYSNEVSQAIGGSDTTPPVISGVTSSNIGTSGATISWTTDETADTQVEYGTTAAYGSTTARNSGMVTSHLQILAGLASSTLYHYRVWSVDGAGNQAVSNDYTFTTIAAGDTTAPVISGVAGSNITVSSATITWATNENSDSQVEYGTTTGYGTSSALNSTLTTSHSQGLAGLTSSTLYHYRVKSRDAAGNLATSNDFTFTTSAVPDTTAPVISGVGSSSVSSNSAAISWTTNEAADTQVEYGTTTGYGASTVLNSSLATSHSQGLTGLTASTLYHYRVKSRDAAGNLATSNDYTFTTTATADTTAPVISSVTRSGLTSSSVTITWTTNEAADTQVEFGATTSYGSSSALNSTLTTSHSQDLTGLTSSTLYHYRVKSRDAAGNLATSADYTFTTTATADTTAPVISAVSSSSITTTGARITWTTNEASDSQVEYGTASGYGTSTTLNATRSTSHSQSLTGLTAGTLYHYRVKSKDAAGNLATSNDYTFTTAIVPDTTPPTITGISSSAGSTGATISWITNEASDSQVNYGKTTSYGSSTTLDSSLTVVHTVTISGLTANTLYHYKVRSKDAAGNIATSNDFTFTTRQQEDAPVISGLTVTNLTTRSATISWSTDKASDSIVEYWPGSQSPETSKLATLVTNHSITLDNLQKRTAYNFRVRSNDIDGDQASQQSSFTTAGSGTAVYIMPNFTSASGGSSSETWMGIAVANQGSQAATLTFTAMDASGNLITGADIVNPGTRTLDPGKQLAIIDFEIFGEGYANSSSKGWIQLESTSADVTGFFMTFDGTLSQMDGTNFSNVALKEFVLTEVEQDGTTKVSMANPSFYPVDVAINLMNSDGSIRSSQSRTIGAKSDLIADVYNDLFAGINPDRSNYLKVSATQGIQPFELMQKTSGDISSLKGQDISGGDTTLYCPQYVAGGIWMTGLSVINLDPNPGVVTFRLMGENGIQIGNAQNMSIGANGKIAIRDLQFFTPLASGEIVSGYVQISTDGVRLAGSVVFGDNVNNSFSSALPLVHSLQKSMTFSHLASNDLYYTGIAILNPNSVDSNVTIEIHDKNGNIIASRTDVLPSLQKKAKLLTELFPSLEGTAQMSGYIRVIADQPIASYALFGTEKVLSAIPPQ